MNKKIWRVFGRPFLHGYQVSMDAGEFPELAIASQLHFQLAKLSRSSATVDDIATFEFPIYSAVAGAVCRLAKL